MKNFGVVLMLLTLVVASSFTSRTESVHEPQFDADIVELAMSQDFLSTLVAAVKAGDLVETLQGDGPFTVFAPTNEAFAKLPEGTVENLLLPENKAQLVKILTYHVVPGKIMASDLKNGQMAETVEGSSLKVTLMDGKAMINNATVTTADIVADNGVVHVIDTVILPPM
ncbi:fasciclin domain-containing protein [Algoriphagus sp. NG3]|uniref:fasciclin domain-containing protein n=1 Tax=Algoriphagus sp. NG3 TaxID=3097546 RepID=UPI002A7FBC0C|nr:fasciclin domain-containing protein [Algoriphagus sp. NG3]WPR75135.1 fasciclin domain-containing protein [Algoriphagus sp. NG3]